MNSNFIEWFESQDKGSRIDSIKKFAIRLDKLKKSLDKANKAELDYGFNRVGIRGGKFTSLNAKSDNCARMYFMCEEELKYMVNKL
ncbi:MAG TPA: hypothetical protein VJ780_06250 [Flavobacterium sp.]|nr:hypothetical protein [Flavobacterium sp.]